LEEPFRFADAARMICYPVVWQPILGFKVGTMVSLMACKTKGR